MTILQGERMAAAANHAADVPPSPPPRNLAPLAWGFLAVTLIGVALWLGTRNVDGRMGAPVPIDESQPAAQQPWRLAVDGIVIGPQPASAAKKPVFKDAEERVIDIYQALRAGDRKTALSLAEALASDLPNFQLGRLLYADLLATSINKPVDLKSLAATSAEGKKNLQALLEESRLRLQALTEVPAAGSLPDNLLALPDSTRHVIAVDTSRSRLYWLVNKAKPGQPLDLVLEKDLYISVGRNGVEKQVEGDGRTPLGVYQTLVLIPRMENNPKGLFKKGGEIKVWIAQDASNLPVKMQLKLNFGAATLLLSDYQAPAVAK